MKYQELIKEVEGVGKLKLSEQEKFYRDVLSESSNDLEVGVAATLQIRKKDSNPCDECQCVYARYSEMLRGGYEWAYQ